MENPNNFLVNTDYPLDMIIYYKYHSFKTNSSKTQDITIAHNLGFAPLLFGSWSFNQDFSKAFSLLSDAYGDNQLALSVKSDENNIYIHKYQYSPQQKNVYIKIYGYAPTTWTGDCEPTAQSNGPLILDTDNKYASLLAAGAIQPFILNPPNPPTQSANDIGKGEYIEIDGRVATANLYYFDPISPVIMTWLTTDGKTELKTNASWSSYGFASAAVPYVNYISNTGITGQNALAIFAGTTREGQANYNDIIHFRVYS